MFMLDNGELYIFVYILFGHQIQLGVKNGINRK